MSYIMTNTVRLIKMNKRKHWLFVLITSTADSVQKSSLSFAGILISVVPFCTRGSIPCQLYTNAVVKEGFCSFNILKMEGNIPSFVRSEEEISGTALFHSV